MTTTPKRGDGTFISINSQKPLTSQGSGGQVSVKPTTGSGGNPPPPPRK